MDRQVAHLPVTRQFPRTGRGRIYRCDRCKGLHFQFGHLSALFDSESFLRLANMVHFAATVHAPKLTGDEHVVIPFSPHLSLLLDRDDLTEINRLVQDALKWLDEPQEAVDLQVN